MVVEPALEESIGEEGAVVFGEEAEGVFVGVFEGFVDSQDFGVFAEPVFGVDDERVDCGWEIWS